MLNKLQKLGLVDNDKVWMITQVLADIISDNHTLEPAASQVRSTGLRDGRSFARDGRGKLRPC